MALAQYPWQEAQAKTLLELKEALPNALLLYGPRGIGTFDLAHAFSQSLLCETPKQDASACGMCRACRLFKAFTHPDMRYLVSEAEALPRNIPFVPPENSAAARKNLYREILIHQTRALTDFLTLKSHEGGRRVVLVYPADKIRAEAAASLLKSIEEPPEGLVFILVADEIDRVLPTIRSRCRLIRATPPTRSEALDWLRSQNVKDPERALEAAGGMPLSVFEVDARLILSSEEEERLIGLLLRGKNADADTVCSLLGRDPALPAYAAFLARWAWDLASVRQGGTSRYFPEKEEDIKKLTVMTDPAKLYLWINSVRDVKRVSSHPLNSRMTLEALLLAYARALS